MKITNDAPRASRTDVKKTGASKTENVTATYSSEKPVASGDVLSLSGAGGQIQSLKSEFDQTPEVRSEKIDAIREELESGTYWGKRDPEAIVSAMLDHFKKYDA